MNIYGVRQSQSDSHVKVAEANDSEINNVFPNLEYTEAKKFNPKWKLDDDEAFYIELEDEDTEIIQNYLDILESSVDCNVCTDNFHKLLSIYVKDDNGIKFQRLWNRYYFKKSYLSFTDLRSDVCTLKLNEKLIMLTNTTDAYWDFSEKRLYFRNFSHIKPMFPGIEKYYRIATKKDLDKLKEKEIINISEDESFGERSLNKIATMVDDNIFEGKSLDDLKDYVREYGKELPEIENGKIVLKTNKDIDLLYKAVNELYYTTDLTNEKRETNSISKIV